MLRKSFSMPAMLLVVAIGLLPARAAELSYPPPFSEVDKDQDEHIDLWEARAVRWLPEYLRTLDQDGDGRLSPNKYGNLRGLAPKDATSRPSDAQ